MRRLGPILLAVALACLSSAPTAVARPAHVQVWVSPHGSDQTGTGSTQHPYRTLQRAQRRVRRITAGAAAPAVTVRLRDGTYRMRRPLRLRPDDSGRPGRPVTYRAASGDAPILSGALRITGWSRWREDPAIWRARVPADAESRDLYVDGERAQRARSGEYPAGFRPAWNGGGSDSGIEYLPTLAPDGLNPVGWGDPTRWRHPEDAEAVLLTQWKQMSVPLRSVVAADGSDPGLLRMRMPAWKNANLFRDPKTGRPGLWSLWQVSWFENALAFLDEPGEWYLDTHADWLYYQPLPGQRPYRSDVELPRLQRLIVGDGTRSNPIHDLRFRGLTFTGTTWLAPSSASGYVADQGGFRLVGSDHEPNTIGHDPEDVATPASVSFSYGHNLRFRENAFEGLGAVGLALGTGSQGDAVRSNRFTGTGSSAITLSGIAAVNHHPQRPAQLARNNTIAGNRISSVAESYRDAPGIYAGFAAGTRITGNTIRDVPWSGIAAGWGWGLLDPPGYPGVPGATQYQWGEWRTPTANRNSVIAGNTITDFLQELWDGGAIYTTGFQGSSAANGLLIRDNIAHGKLSSGGGNVFYTDGGSRWITLKGNVSYDNQIGGLNFGPPPRPGDPLPYSSLPSDGNGVPYGSEIGGCRTYGDIAYRRNSWFEAPIWDQIPLYNDLYELISGGEPGPYSSEGFFDVCPYSQDGVDYPANLSFEDNAIYPAEPPGG